MVEITLFRIDLEGSSFTADTPFGDQADDSAPAAESTEGGGLGRSLAVVAGLVFLVAAAVVVRRTLDGRETIERP